MNQATRKKLERSGFKPTPKNLHATLQRGSSDMAAKVELCLQAGLSPDTREPKRPGRTPLMSALSHPKPQPMLIARLLEAGANPALTDEDGWSAVAHLAARFQGEAGKGLDTFAKRWALLTAHPDVTPEDRALWSPGLSPWVAFFRLSLRALARKKPHLAARMKGPATAAQLAKVRTAFERSLPDPLLNLYRVCNGMAEGAFLGKWRLLPLAEMVEVAHSLRGRKLVNDLGSRGYRGLNWSPRFIPFGTDKAGDLLFTAPRMLGDRAFIKPLDPVYLYQHAEDQVVYRFAQLRGELPKLFSQAGLPRG